MGGSPRARKQLFVGDDVIRILYERTLADLPWRELGVDVVDFSRRAVRATVWLARRITPRWR